MHYVNKIPDEDKNQELRFLKKLQRRKYQGSTVPSVPVTKNWEKNNVKKYIKKTKDETKSILQRVSHANCFLHNTSARKSRPII